MDFQIKMNVKPGDMEVSKATVAVYDKNGVQQSGQMVLEGETAETRLMLPEGGRIEVKAFERPLVYDQEQKAAVPADLTPKDPLTDPNRPVPEPLHPKGVLDPKSVEHSGGGQKLDEKKMVDTKPAHTTLSDTPKAKDDDHKSKK